MTQTSTGPMQQAWHEYHATLEEMRLLLESTSRYQRTPQHRAKAYHVLMEMQAMAYTFAISPRMSHPRIFFNTGWQTDIYTLGQNGQDFLYGTVFLDGRQTYRMTGRLGDISVFLLQTLSGLFGEPGVKATGNYDMADFKVGKDGRFEIMLSATEQSGNWIRLDPNVGYQFMLIRRSLVNWDGDRGELRLERVSEIDERHYDADEFDENAIATRIRRASLFVRYLIKDFTLNLYDMYFKNAGSERNKLVLLPGTVTSEVGSPSSNYAMAVFELHDDEALIIEMDRKPDGTYWSFQLGDVWSRSLNFSTRQSSLNDREVVTDGDGRLRIVVSHRDPGIANWLDCCNRVEGTIVFRNYRAKTAPVPTSRKVKFAELDSVLPKDSRRRTAAERKQDMQQRRMNLLKLYGE